MAERIDKVLNCVGKGCWKARKERFRWDPVKGGKRTPSGRGMEGDGGGDGEGETGWRKGQKENTFSLFQTKRQFSWEKKFRQVLFFFLPRNGSF